LNRAFHESIAAKHYSRRAFDMCEFQRRMLNALALPPGTSTPRHKTALEERAALINPSTVSAIRCTNS